MWGWCAVCRMRRSAPERLISKSCSYAGRPQGNLVGAPSEMRNPRLVVDVQDQLPTKEVSETLRARAYSRCQQLTYKLHAHLGLRSSAFLQGACLLLLLQPATPATTAHRQGDHPGPASPEPERGRRSLDMSWRKRQVPLDFWPYRPSPAIDLVFRSLLAKTLKFRQD